MNFTPIIELPDLDQRIIETTRDYQRYQLGANWQHNFATVVAHHAVMRQQYLSAGKRAINKFHDIYCEMLTAYHDLNIKFHRFQEASCNSSRATTPTSTNSNARSTPIFVLNATPEPSETFDEIEQLDKQQPPDESSTVTPSERLETLNESVSSTEYCSTPPAKPTLSEHSKTQPIKLANAESEVAMATGQEATSSNISPSDVAWATNAPNDQLATTTSAFPPVTSSIATQPMDNANSGAAVSMANDNKTVRVENSTLDPTQRPFIPRPTPEATRLSQQADVMCQLPTRRAINAEPIGSPANSFRVSEADLRQYISVLKNLVRLPYVGMQTEPINHRQRDPGHLANATHRCNQLKFRLDSA